MFIPRSVRGWLSFVVFVGIVAVMDYVFIEYLISHGLELKMQPAHFGSFQFSFPIVGLTFAGVLIVAIAAWIYVIGTIREIYGLEAVRALALCLFFFSATLFVPYIVGSSFFQGGLSSLSRSIPQFAGVSQDLSVVLQSTMVLDSLTKLALSQDLAAAALVAVSGVMGYRRRRLRKR